jgi:hypothetical protein
VNGRNVPRCEKRGKNSPVALQPLDDRKKAEGRLDFAFEAAF